ncbi:hypothetical protein Mgra_00004932 [Meloidogyne graminicola]|uniref:Uncharacterized protein n=1 Tax=Meloidogyne graminicola TaxID=189291 RepID=A0A8S9ZQK3_9BILA|nr:hypothetical protein Mgra_00004932 [Meloidogyne graminicola]
MVRSLPSTSVSILKRKSSDYENQTTIKIESDSNLPTMEDHSSSSTTMVQSSSDIKNLSDNKLNVHRKTKNKFNIPKATKLVEVHDDSPEFTHRSPLQLFSATQEQKIPINNNVKPIETIQKQQNFPPRRAFHHRQRFDSGPRWNNSYNNNSFGYHQQNSRFYFHQQQNDGFFGPPGLRRQPFEQPVRMNNNFIQNDSSSVLERTTVPEQCGHFEKHKDNNVEPKNNQQQLEEPQAMDTAVNELHQISQIMKYPCGAYNYSSAGYVNIAHIPLPPSPKSDFLHTPFEGSGILASDGSSDPFTEVDQLAQLGQMMHE